MKGQCRKHIFSFLSVEESWRSAERANMSWVSCRSRTKQAYTFQNNIPVPLLDFEEHHLFQCQNQDFPPWHRHHRWRCTHQEPTWTSSLKSGLLQIIWIDKTCWVRVVWSLWHGSSNPLTIGLSSYWTWAELLTYCATQWKIETIP